MNHPYQELSKRVRRIAGLVVEITESCGGHYCNWDKDTRRFVVGIAHPDHYGTDHAARTYTMYFAAGYPRREAVRQAAASCRDGWHAGATL